MPERNDKRFIWYHQRAELISLVTNVEEHSELTS